jgi:DNA-binding transcriptional MerR regulator
MAQRSPSRPPKKLFYKIGEVCEITDTEPYVLRYWESEFPFLAPEKNRAGQRIYSDEDIETVNAIKRLLYEEGYTTAGARRRLEKELAERRREGSATPAAPAAPAEALPAPADATGDAEARAAVRSLREGLRELRALLVAAPTGATPPRRGQGTPRAGAGPGPSAAETTSPVKTKSPASARSPARSKGPAKTGRAGSVPSSAKRRSPAKAKAKAKGPATGKTQTPPKTRAKPR